MTDNVKLLASELHKPVRHNFKRRKIIVNGIDEIWALDLADMQAFSTENKGEKYILTVIDCFSRYAWALPLKDKTANTVLKAMQSIVKDSGRIPEKIWSDAGKEFVNKDFSKWLKENKISLYHTYSENKSAVIERFNRTLKTLMWVKFTENRNHKWINILDPLLNFYNNKVHRGIGITPTQASEKKNEGPLLQKNFTDQNKHEISKPKLKLGDKVRISKVKGKFEKGYLPAWSTEVFTINKVINSYPPSYLIEDEKGETIKGSFYEPELQKTKLENTYVVEKVLKSKIVKGHKQVLVKWYGYPDSENSWIDAKDLI